jgi:hypothetical protein
MYIANATITVKTESSTPSGFDPVTGAPIFLITIATVIASLEEVANPDVPRSPGIEETAIYLEGRALNPAQLPASFVPNRKYSVLLNRAGGTVEGELYLLPSARSRLGLESVFNDPIEGWLVI